MDNIRVASNSDSKQLASFIASTLKKQERVELKALGASAVNQAIKAIAIARGYTIYYNFDLVCSPGFNTEIVNGGEKSVISLTVSKKYI